MLEMFDKEMTVKDLKEILSEMDDRNIVCSENVQDGINRHNEICGYEDDSDDEYFILKIDNEAQKEKEKLSTKIIKYLESKKKLSSVEASILKYANDVTE